MFNTNQLVGLAAILCLFPTQPSFALTDREYDQIMYDVLNYKIRDIESNRVLHSFLNALEAKVGTQNLLNAAQKPEYYYGTTTREEQKAQLRYDLLKKFIRAYQAPEAHLDYGYNYQSYAYNAFGSTYSKLYQAICEALARTLGFDFLNVMRPGTRAYKNFEKFRQTMDELNHHQLPDSRRNSPTVEDVLRNALTCCYNIIAILARESTSQAYAKFKSTLQNLKERRGFLHRLSLPFTKIKKVRFKLPTTWKLPNLKRRKNTRTMFDPLWFD